MERNVSEKAEQYDFAILPIEDDLTMPTSVYMGKGWKPRG